MKVKQLLAPLLKKRPDLAYSRGYLLLVPFTHYARGVVFYHCPQYFRAKAFSAQVYAGHNILMVPFLDEKQASRYFDGDCVDHPKQSSQALCDFVENEALPAIEMIDNPTEHARRPEYLPGEPLTPRAEFALALGACYMGDFVAAEEHLQRIRIPANHPWADPKWQILAQTLETDVGKIPKLLHEWEAFTIKETRIKAQYWKSVPFPCEERIQKR